MMLLLASSSTNYFQKASKIAQFSTKNAKKISQKRSLSKTKIKYFQNFYLHP